MKDYIATFHTHFSAVKTHRSLGAAGIEAVMMPTLRALSSSCGTCVAFQADRDMRECLDGEYECLYLVEGEGDYQRLLDNR
ncbi:DUF3343 domain-containing protein [Eubacterium barkeri]|uniref:Putative Se/S carrier protein-like domain-containing protein n=1 Tax=Eubacterium barkeri TaxID=1528 RepID=A0A1H3FHQ0_EUBBA|nr:DUF3343 domain-containing protein [Eubacterium barkeri]SDX90365.1 Protein of unknown function [Eubacterium barkeri]